MSSSSEISTSLRSSPGNSAVISISLSVSVTSMLGMRLAVAVHAGSAEAAREIVEQTIDLTMQRAKDAGFGVASTFERDRGMEPVLSGSWLSSIGGCLLSSDKSRCAPGLALRGRLRAHDDAVFDLGDARRRPGHPLGLFALDPRAHRAFEDHFAAVGFDDECGWRRSRRCA